MPHDMVSAIYMQERGWTSLAFRSPSGITYRNDFQRICDVVTDLLTGLAGSKEVIGVHWLGQGRGRLVDPVKAEQWWNQARAMGEESYLLRHILPDKNSDKAWVNDHNAFLIAAKYPRHLPKLYQEMLNRYPHAQSRLLAELLHR